MSALRSRPAEASAALSVGPDLGGLTDPPRGREGV
jgi:hypothetical protein